MPPARPTTRWRGCSAGYPGGRVLDELARAGDPGAIVFPCGMTGDRDDPYAFSFSGLKTAVARYVEANPMPRWPTSAGFQEAVADAHPQGSACRDRPRGVHLLIAGGVAANFPIA